MTYFKFKQFGLNQSDDIMKINTDSVLMGACTNGNEVKTILDIGTGSGIIALMLAQRYPHSQVTAIDIDDIAYNIAKSNFEDSPFDHRIRMVHASLQEFDMQHKSQFDLIVSNPPYFTYGLLSSKSRKNLARHAFSLTHQTLIRISAQKLTSNGRLVFILPYKEAKNLIESQHVHGVFLNEVLKIRYLEHKPIERMILHYSLEDSPLIQHELVLYDGKGPKSFTKAYENLVKDFYLFL